VIRRATIADLDVVTALSARTYRDAYASMVDPVDLERHIADDLAADRIGALLGSPACTFLLLEEDGRPIGYAIVREGPAPSCVTEPKPVEIVRFYLEQHVIGKGNGSRLMRACLDHAREVGAESIWLGVWERNERACRFYERSGFRTVGVHPIVFAGKTYEDLVMVRSLGVGRHDGEAAIRAATIADAAAIAALSTQLGYSARGEEIAARLGVLLSRPEDAVLVAELRRTGGPPTPEAETEGARRDIAGWIHVAEQTHVVSDPRCDILGLVVDVSVRRSGVGRKLVCAAESWARDRGLTRIVVRSNAARAASHPFYARLAYRCVKTQHVYDKDL